MRRAGYDSGWHVDSKGRLVGVSLHGDATTEHEVGITSLKSALGIASSFRNGLPDRTMTQDPPVFKLGELVEPDGTKGAMLVVSNGRYRDWVPETPDAALNHLVRSELYLPSMTSSFSDPEKGTFAAAWDERGFAIRVRGEQDIQRLNELAQALRNKDIALGYDLLAPEQEGGVRKGGITLVRPSLVQPKLAAQALEKDTKKIRLQTAAQAILEDLEPRLHRAGHHWFALSPNWNDRDDESKGIHFWLNPVEQSAYNYGPYTAEELEQWARNHGPIMKDRPLAVEAARQEENLEWLERQLRGRNFQLPTLLVIRTRSEEMPFGICVSYQGHPAAPKGQGRLEEGVFTFDQLRDQVNALGRSRKRGLSA